MIRQALAALLLTGSAAPVLTCAAARASPPVLTVLAADGLAGPMNDIGALWNAAGHGRIAFSFAPDAALAARIDGGARANLFVSADQAPIYDVSAHRMLVEGSRRDVVDDSLVLVMPRAGLRPVTLAKGVALDRMLGPTGRLALSDPAHVFSGQQAEQALQKLGLWPAMRPRLLPAPTVGAALRLVESGQAAAAIVYATDVAGNPRLAIAGVFPEASHEPARCSAVILKAGDTQAARDFLAFLGTQPAHDVFAHYGFSSP